MYSTSYDAAVRLSAHRYSLPRRGSARRSLASALRAVADRLDRHPTTPAPAAWHSA